MTAPALLLGVINIGIVAATWLLVGLVIVWLVKWFFEKDVPDEVRKAYLILVGLIVIYMVVALLLGLPTVRFL